MNSNKGKQKFFVIYQITNLLDGRIYVGAHVTYNVNDKYMGSSKYLKKDMKELGRENFKKKILYVFNDKEDMISKEAEIVNREFCHRKDTYNRMVGGISDWSCLDMTAVKDEQGNIMLVYKDDPRYLSGELVGVRKGVPNEVLKNKVVVVDGNGNYILISKEDPKYISGELKSYRKGRKQHSNFSWINKKHSEETKRKMSEKASERIGERNSQYGTCWVTDGSENKKIKKENLEDWLDKGYLRGRK